MRIGSIVAFAGRAYLCAKVQLEHLESRCWLSDLNVVPTVRATGCVRCFLSCQPRAPKEPVCSGAMSLEDYGTWARYLHLVWLLLLPSSP